MSQTRISNAEREAMLASTSNLGASQAPSQAVSIPRAKILGMLAVAGASLASAQSAEAEIILANPNVNVGGGFNDLSYNVISYAYETTEPAAVPEPNSLVLGAMAAPTLDAAGVRKWKDERKMAEASA
jgi:hypothetical protein